MATSYHSSQLLPTTTSRQRPCFTQQELIQQRVMSMYLDSIPPCSPCLLLCLDARLHACAWPFFVEQLGGAFLRVRSCRVPPVPLLRVERQSLMVRLLASTLVCAASCVGLCEASANEQAFCPVGLFRDECTEPLFTNILTLNITPTYIRPDRRCHTNF